MIKQLNNQNLYVISVGSNASRSRHRVLSAIRHLRRNILRDFVASPTYRTPSISADGTTYCNAVVAGLSTLTVDELNLRLKDYERMSGRVHHPGARITIDLDIVIANGVTIRPVDALRSYFTIGLSLIPVEMLQRLSRASISGMPSVLASSR